MTENRADRAVARARAIDTATLSDALDKLDIAGQCLGIKPLDHGFRLAGRAFTLLYAPLGVPPGTVGDYIDDIEPDHIAVLDNGGREDATVWGDILTLVANARHIGGTVIDGACRDTSLAREIGYPIFSRSYSMRTGKDRVQLEATNVVVTVGAARVAPGDILVGDADGVVAIPRMREGEVLDVAEAIEAAEAHIRASVRQGSSLREARAEHKYHQLQSRER